MRTFLLFIAFFVLVGFSPVLVPSLDDHETRIRALETAVFGGTPSPIPIATVFPTPTQEIQATPVPTEVLRVTVTRLRVRACPGTSCAIVGSVTAGTILRVTLGQEMANGFTWRQVDATGEWVAQGTSSNPALFMEHVR